MVERSKASNRPGMVRIAMTGAAWAVMLSEAGCSRSPSINILGSFFPSWIFCGLIGILLTAAVRLLFVHFKFEQELSPLILIYPCVTAIFTFTLWLLFFS